MTGKVLKVSKLFVGVMLMFSALTGCEGKAINEANVEELKEKWASSSNNSAHSWWYAGSTDSDHTIILKTSPISKTRYHVSKTVIKLQNIQLFSEGESKDNWVNLKRDNLEF